MSGYTKGLDDSIFDTSDFGAEEFLGKVIQAEWQESKFKFDEQTGEALPTLYVEVENLTRNMPFNYSRRFDPPKGQRSTQSIWYKLVHGLEECGFKLRVGTVEEELPGKVFWFKRYDVLKMGKMEAKGVFFPVRIATEEDVFAATAAKVQAQVAANTALPIDAASNDESEIDNSVLSLCTGVTYGELQDAVSQMFPEYEARVDRHRINKLVSSGKLALREGRYEVVG